MKILQLLLILPILFFASKSDADLILSCDPFKILPFPFKPSDVCKSTSMELNTTGNLQARAKDPKDVNFWFNFDTVVMWDEINYSADADTRRGNFASGGNIRLLYLSFTGGLCENLSYKFIPSFPTDRFVDLRDTFIEYTPTEDLDFQVGNIPIPSSMEDYQNEQDYMFLELSLLGSVFFPLYDYGLGVFAEKSFPNGAIMAAVYEPTSSDLRNFGDIIGNDLLGESIRMTFSPIHTEKEVYHLGAWFRHQALRSVLQGELIPPDVAFVGFDGPPEVVSRNFAIFIDTGPMRASSFNLMGLEAGFMCGPVLLTSEYLYATVSKLYSLTEPVQFADQVNFKAWYLQGGYVLTGESHEYSVKDGFFKRVKPKSPYGAIEIAARYSFANLMSGFVKGGNEHDVVLGVNWYINDQVRITANYINAWAFPTSIIAPGTAVLPKRTLDIYAIRFTVATY